ncbi:MAG: flagellin [Clostridium sp.]|nr:flagellin [Clostridium sp.]
MIVQHNITSMTANRQLGIVGNNLAKSTEKLSSGYRINRAADDAAGLAISEKMRAQVRGLNRASDNAQDGISLIQTAEGAMDQQHAILQRTRELLVQASNTGVLDSAQENDFQKIQDEINTLKNEYTRIGTDTEFNKKKLLDGSYQNEHLQVGANKNQGISVSIDLVKWDLKDFTDGTNLKDDFKSTKTSTVLKGTFDTDGKAETQQKQNDKVANYDAFSGLIDDVDTMIKSVSTQRSKLGAIQNRLEYTVKVDDNTAENLQSAESRIRDTDMADEMTRFSKESILQQAATSMLAQANQSNQGVLSLLQ